MSLRGTPAQTDWASRITCWFLVGNKGKHVIYSLTPQSELVREVTASRAKRAAGAEGSALCRLAGNRHQYDRNRTYKSHIGAGRGYLYGITCVYWEFVKYSILCIVLVSMT